MFECEPFDMQINKLKPKHIYKETCIGIVGKMFGLEWKYEIV